MPAKLTTPMEGLRRTKAHRYAALWRIERTDGVTLRFTDHDTDLSYLWVPSVETTPQVYKAAGSFQATARERQAGVQEHNLEVVGVLTADAITEDDLRRGLYREAKVTEALVDWKFPYAGEFARSVYWVTGVTRTHETWRVQLSGLPAWLRRPVGWLHQHECRYALYDPDTCKVDKASFTFSAVVTSIGAPRNHFFATAITQAAGYFKYGLVHWTSGGNVGTVDADVIEHLSGGEVKLALFAPSPITPGDAFDVSAGCDHQWSTCKDKFANGINFGGYPYIPGNDRILRGPL